MKTKAKFRTPYDDEKFKCCVSFEGTETITEQHHKDLCDIKNIIRMYDKTGLITHVAKSTAQYGDFTIVNEYQDSLNVVIQADQAFSEIPSDIRKQFGNDAGAFFEFATNPENHDKMVEMGLANPAEIIEPVVQKVEIVGGSPDPTQT